MKIIFKNLETKTFRHIADFALWVSASLRHAAGVSAFMMKSFATSILCVAVLAVGSGCEGSAGRSSVAADSGADDPDSDAADAAPRGLTLEQLGELLYHDTNLSAHRTQACASCHDPDAAFVDVRVDDTGYVRAASLGDDGHSLGQRNAPSAAYASYVPVFGKGTRERHNTDGDLAEYRGYLGGLFHDGRATSLENQAAGPPLNPIEMGMPDKRSVVERIVEEPSYAEAFETLYGSDIWDDTDGAYAAMTNAIAAYERTDEFAPFDSRYDRSLLPPSDDDRYVYHPASAAAQGKALFFSAEFTNCAACHQLHPLGSTSARKEVFTGFEYHNIGVPENEALRELTAATVDLGLGGQLGEEAEDGKFKTPTLRNVALTAPYMHNGVFRELSTVIRFYEHVKRRARGDLGEFVNPETDEPWKEPEVSRNLSDDELGSGNKDLSEDEHVVALECFLMSLTDARYEPLLDAEKVERCGL